MKRAALLLGALAVVSIVVAYTLEGAARIHVSNVAFTAGSVVALLGAHRARRRDRPFRFLLAGTSAFLVGQFAWDVLAFVHVAVPTPSPADAGYLLFPILAGIGLYQLAPTEPRERRQAQINAVALVVSVLAIGAALMADDVRGSALPLAGRVTAAAYSALYVALLVVLVEAFAGARAALRDRALILVLGGVTVEAFAFAAWGHQLLLGTYAQGTETIDALWTLGLLLIGSAGFVAENRAALPTTTTADRRFRGILPNIALLALIGTQLALMLLERPLVDRLVAIVALSVVGALLLFRAHLLIRERSGLLARERAANDALQRVNRELDAFAYSASHDLKAPLVSIDGLSASLERRVGDALDERSRHYLARIRANVATLQSLIQDVLDYARSGTSDAPPQIDADEVTRDLLDELRPFAAERGAELELAASIPPLCAHPVRYRQALANLVENAICHGGAGEPVHVRIDGSASNGHVRVAVEDDGRGVDAQTRDTMFELFAKGPTGGTGVGLALAKRIVESSGGSIAYEPLATGGSRFVLAFRRGAAE